MGVSKCSHCPYTQTFCFYKLILHGSHSVLASSGSYPSISKKLVKDLVADDVVGPIGGLNFEKLEGMAMNGEGWWIVNDNDGVEDNSGEIQLMNLGSI
mmetsp:Transcript_45091/g.66361  ORF Transcript_45091/g.66361 Transcript_45091/m.66361 type:complete len:98 (-) Transcript_45091:111-404(-)